MKDVSYPNLRLAPLTDPFDIDIEWLKSSRLVIDSSALKKAEKRPQVVTVYVNDRRRPAGKQTSLL
jgi:hypothetical protein